ncbi:LOW QUALITY PROTEIN: prostatic acid phosphatase-like [Asterias amurensis]|uniref:LOW QUALITY PROTEIN: prostatic acid phosphatase-like n=1 Tax=Asterias amurensis TaxID=7602 RepID=UPI003AB11BDD
MDHLMLITMVLAICSTFSVNGERSLQLVNVLYRHGDRTPVDVYPSDPHKADTWPEGLGQLTTHGMNMHYELGQWLRERYIKSGFLNETYNRDALHVRSTDKDRTLMSAESDLSGLYPPKGNQIWKSGLTWMPIPVHTIPLDQDYLLKTNGPPCPNYDELKKETTTTKEYLAVQERYKDFLKNLTINTGFKEPLTVSDVYLVEDPLFVERLHGLQWPDWANVTGFYKDLKTVSDKGMYFLFNSKDKSRLKGGPLLGEIIENMRNKSETKDPTDLRRKFYMYSAHDTTVAALLSALGIYNGIQPPLASCVIVELWKEDNGENTVNILFRNDTLKAPYPLVIKDCEASCPLGNFTMLTKDMVPEDIKAACGITSPFLSNSISIIILISIVIGLLVVTILTLIGLLICRCRQSKIRHVRLQSDDTNA